MDEISFTNSIVIKPINNIVLNRDINNNSNNNNINHICSQEESSFFISHTNNNLLIGNNKRFSLYTYLNQIKFFDYLRIKLIHTEDINQRHIKLKNFLYDYFNGEIIITYIDSLIVLILELNMSLIEAFNLIMYYKHSLLLQSLSDCYFNIIGWEERISNIEFLLKKIMEETENLDDDEENLIDTNEYKYFYSRRKVLYNHDKNIFNYLPIECNNNNICNKECTHSHSIIEMLYHPLIYKKFECRSKICEIEKYYGIDYCPFYHKYYYKNNDNSFKNNCKMGDLYKINEINSKLLKVLENINKKKDEVYKDEEEDEHKLSIFNNKIDCLDVELIHVLCREFNFNISISNIISKYQVIEKKVIVNESFNNEYNIDFYSNWNNKIKNKILENKLIKCINCKINIYMKGKYRGKICNHFLCSECYNKKEEKNFDETYINKCDICCINQVYECI